jgi:hypothetical protein
VMASIHSEYPRHHHSPSFDVASEGPLMPFLIYLDSVQIFPLVPSLSYALLLSDDRDAETSVQITI